MPGNIDPSRLASTNRKTISWRFFYALSMIVLIPFSKYVVAQSQEAIRDLQIEQIDSKKRGLHILHDSTRVDALNKISSMYYKFVDFELDYKQTDSARLFAEQAGREARLINYVRGLAVSLKNLGEIECERGYFKKSEPYFLQAIQLSKKSNFSTELNSAYIGLGWSLLVQGNYQEARNRLEGPLVYFKSVSDEVHESMAFRMIGNSYSNQGYYLKAFEYYQKDYLKSKKPDDTYGNLYSPRKMGYLFLIEGDTAMALSYFQQPVNYSNIKGFGYYSGLANIYSLRKQYDSALFALEQYNNLIQTYDDDVAMQKRWLMFNAGNLGRINNALRNYDRTINLLQEPLRFFSIGGDMNQVLTVLLQITKAYDAKNNNKETLYYGKQLVVYAESCGARQFMRDGYWLLWRVFNRQGNIDQAYRFHLKYTALKNVIESDEHHRKIAAASWILKVEQQQAQINLLDKNNKIKEQTLADESLLKKVYAGSLIALILLSTILFRNLSLKRKNENLRNEKKQASLQNQATELEMQALRAQMNPHFIFNSLNSINRFILQNNKAQASEYLTKFSKLIRLILQNSQAALIPLKSELESLELYLDLEAVRFNHHFDYKISINKNLDLTALNVPPLVIQPYAENAIWHGLMHKEEKGQLDIEVTLENGLLLLKIKDNGIGREQASTHASKSATRNKSMGLKITADRLAMLQSGSHHSPVRINDLVHADGSAAGTEVIIKIPAIYD